MPTGLGIRGVVNELNQIIMCDGEVEKEDLIFMIRADSEIPDRYKNGKNLEVLVDNLINPTKYSAKTPRSLKEKHKERFELYNRGLNDVEIADKQKTTVATITNWRIKHKLPSNSKTQYKEVHKKRLELHKKGLTDRKIADNEGCKVTAIHNWRKRNNLEANKK